MSQNLPSHRKVEYAPVGHCIYCLSDDPRLSMEHIVPRSFGGKWELPSASCPKCAAITSFLEQSLSKGCYLPLRTKFKYPTYGKAYERPTGFPIEILRADGTIEVRELATSEYPSLYPVILLPEPGILVGREPSMTNPELSIELRGNADDIEKLSALSKDGEVRITHSLPVYELVRVLAKMGHSLAVALLGESGYEPFLPNVILGNDPDGYRYVGGWPYAFVCYIGDPLGGIGITVHNGYLVALISLLHGRLPTYSVVIGRPTDPTVFERARTNPLAMPVQSVPFWEHRLSPGKS